ncbi:MAG: ketosteroid isomerase family protein [Leptolyngbyaceae cyanobacterium bins.349]|nr:ketosteroid isomerase family protein [Leptolyngbyaceae cyanobacterium bins.349]
MSVVSGPSATSPLDFNQDSQAIAIAGVDEPVILRYFSMLNAGEFEAVGQLFAVDGALQPPFEDLVVGRAAIAAYLDQEAKGFLLEPQSGSSTLLDNGCTEFGIMGKVQTPWFSVNVGWTFILSPAQEIFLVKVKLLAALQDLLPLRDAASKDAASKDAANKKPGPSHTTPQ